MYLRDFFALKPFHDIQFMLGLHFTPASVLGPVYNYPCARVTLARGLKSALVYKQISQVGLPYHPGQLYQLY